MMRSTTLALLLLASLGGQALGSTPQAVYTDPRRVDLLPTDATATRVVIYGVFFKWNADGSYTEPSCGYMHYVCKAGEEAMCRMQWKELRDNYIGNANNCAGFGQMSMVSTAKIYPIGTAIGAPATWDLGVGLSTGVSVSNRCPAAKKLQCVVSEAPDAGTGPEDLASGETPDLSTTMQPPKPPTSTGCTASGAASASAGLPALFLALGLLLRRRRR